MLDVSPFGYPEPVSSELSLEDDEEEPSATTATTATASTTAPAASHARFGIFGSLSIRSGPPPPALARASRFLGLGAASFGAAHLAGA